LESTQKGTLDITNWLSSQDTAVRDIQDLINKMILRKEASGDRSTNYELIE